MASRQSIDSTHSSAPLIENPVSFQPPPPHYINRDTKGKGSSKFNDPAKKIKISTITLAIRIIALIVTLIVAISFSVQRSSAPEAIAITILLWINVVWDAFMVLRGLRHPFLQISLVLGNDRVIRFARPDDHDVLEEGEGGEDPERRRKRECRSPRAFWADAGLVVATFGLNLGVTIHAYSYYRYRAASNWTWVAM